MLDETKGRMKKVLCPIERNGKTYWLRFGQAYVNKDNSINLYLDGWPTNGKLQVRDWDDKEDFGRRREGSGTGQQAPQFALHALPSIGGGEHNATPDDNTPF